MTSQHAPAPDAATAQASRPVLAALAVDAVLVVVFAAIGRASHGEAVLTGLWTTAWPFLGGLVLGWVVTFAWRSPTAPLRPGLGIWAVTVAAGMGLRAASGQGTATAFVVVASVTLLVFLVGWRILATLVARRRVA